VLGHGEGHTQIIIDQLGFSLSWRNLVLSPSTKLVLLIFWPHSEAFFKHETTTSSYIKILEQTQDMDICLLGRPEGLPEAAAGVAGNQQPKYGYDRSN